MFLAALSLPALAENIAWKLELPAKSGATPIVWDNNVFPNVADGGNLYLWRVDKTRGTPPSLQTRVVW